MSCSLRYPIHQGISYKFFEILISYMHTYCWFRVNSRSSIVSEAQRGKSFSGQSWLRFYWQIKHSGRWIQSGNQTFLNCWNQANMSQTGQSYFLPQPFPLICSSKQGSCTFQEACDPFLLGPALFQASCFLPAANCTLSCFTSHDAVRKIF